MELEEYLAVPYKLIMESFEGPDGDWLRRASYPELPGCDVEGLWAVDVVEALEQLRIQLITERFQHREYIPVPAHPSNPMPRFSTKTGWPLPSTC